MHLHAADTAGLLLGDKTMTSQSKNDLKKIKDAINMLARLDRRTHLTTPIGDNPAAVDATLALIEDLCAVIRQQEGLTVETIEC